MSSTAFILSVFAYIPRLLTMKPKNFLVEEFVNLFIDRLLPLLTSQGILLLG